MRVKSIVIGIAVIVATLIFLSCFLCPVAGRTDKEVTLVGAGDIGECKKKEEGKPRVPGEASLATARLVQASLNDEAIVFTLGDNAYAQGTTEDFMSCYEPTLGKFKNRTKPAIGNHEYYSDERKPNGYFGYFGNSAGPPPPKGFYSYELNGWLILVLNSPLCVDREAYNYDPTGCEEQFLWLSKELKEKRLACTLTYFHHPIFNSGEHGDTKAMWPTFKLLYDKGVDIILSGHQHSYERYVPLGMIRDQGELVPRLDDKKGIRTFVVGTGGAELDAFSTPQPITSVVRAGKYEKAHGVLKLTLRQNGYAWAFLPAYGTQVNVKGFPDAGEAVCH